MPTPTYTPLATVTLGASASSVTFSSIPATYRDLIIVDSSRSARVSTVDFLLFRVNGDTGSNYSRVAMYNVSNTPTSVAQTLTVFTADTRTAANSTANTFGIGVSQIMDYSATDKHKTVLIRTSAPNFTYASANRWANTAAITSINLFMENGNIAAGSTFSLYGVIA
jgi:hypothetical protein